MLIVDEDENKNRITPTLKIVNGTAEDRHRIAQITLDYILSMF